ncbi:MAG: hypothetical protein Sapg2KO_25890 [Saprospiraceae bacterium]
MIVSINACSKQKQAVETEAFQAMMKLQDEIRPQMSDINRLTLQLEKLETSVDSSDRQLLGEIDLAIRALEKADQGMMAWINMNSGNKLEILQSEKSHQEIMQYLEEEQQNLQKVNTLMLSSIEQAKKLVQSMPE